MRWLLRLMRILTWGPVLVEIPLLRRLILRRSGVVVAPLRGGGRALRRSARLLRGLAADPDVRAVLVQPRGMRAGWATMAELRAAVAALRRPGRTVTAVLDEVALRDLYLASAADRVVLAPPAEALVEGIGARLVFVGDLLRGLGLDFEVESAGDYKSFGEQWTRGWPTRPNREQLAALVADLQDHVVSELAAGRDRPVRAVTGLFARSPVPAGELLERGLADALAYPDEVVAEAARDRRPVSLARLARLADLEERFSEGISVGPGVVVLHLDGPVVLGREGPSRGPRIEADAVVPALRKLARDETVAAVVLAVDTPGGSALASDLLARGVRRLAARKPVVVAMGDVCASGGYYLAAAADEIVAAPLTITGSIGVVALHPVASRAARALGVHAERVAAGPSSGLASPWAPLDRRQRERLRAMVARAYDRFLDTVSAGRRLPRAHVEAVARGRVWTGRQALEQGLVDRLGDLATAVERARARADLGPRAPVWHRRLRKPPLQRLRAMLAGGGAARVPLRDEVIAVALRASGRPLALLSWLPEAPGAGLPLSGGWPGGGPQGAA